MEINEKRPERVLEKSDHQEARCTCGNLVKVSNGQTSATCSCGQALNWGLRK